MYPSRYPTCTSFFSANNKIANDALRSLNFNLIDYLMSKGETVSIISEEACYKKSRKGIADACETWCTQRVPIRRVHQLTA